MRVLLILLSSVIFCVETSSAANPFEKFKGCYQIVNFSGADAFSKFKPQTLSVTARKKSDYSHPDGNYMSGLEFLFCIHNGPVSVCRGQMAYDSFGSYGLSNAGADYFLYGGDACEVGANSGYTCGSLLENISIKEELGLLKITGDRHSIMPAVDGRYKASYSTTVQKIPLTNGLCR